MSKVEVFGPLSLYFDVLGAIHHLGVLHIEDVSKSEIPSELDVRPMDVSPEALQRKERLEASFARINAILSVLGSHRGLTPPADTEGPELSEDDWTIDTIENRVDTLVVDVERTTRELATRKDALERERAALMQYMAILSKIEPIARKQPGLEQYKTMAFVMERKHRAVLDLIRAEIKKITDDRYTLVSADIDETTTAAILYFDPRFEETVHSFLWGENINELRLPEELAKKPLQDALSYMNRRIAAIPGEVEDIEKELARVSARWYLRLSHARQAVANWLQELQIVTHVGQTDYAFIIEGWVPTKFLPTLRSSLARSFGTKVVAQELHLSHEELEDAPVVLENPWVVKSFEAVMKLFPPPRYGSIDPTVFLAIFYPIFFGLIIGDVAYGLFLLFITLIVRWRFKRHGGIMAVANMLMMAAIMTIFFGFVYGEFLGEIGKDIGIVRPIPLPFGLGELEPFERGHDIMTLLVIVLIIGATQMVLGQVLGIINAIREKAPKHLLEKTGMLLLLLAIAVLVLGILPEPLESIPLILLIVGVALLAYGGGIVGVTHLFGVFGKIFSYLRLMALGLAGLILADAANAMGSAIEPIWVGVLVALLIHLINIVFHTVSSSIHSFRLVLLELFGQFKEDARKTYKPFKIEGGESA